MSYLVQVIKEPSNYEVMHLEKDYKIDVIEEKSFDSKSEANKFAESMKEKYSLKKMGHHFANSNTGYELSKNY